MAWDYIVKLRPLFSRFGERPIPSSHAISGAIGSAP